MSEVKVRFDKRARVKARRTAVQALYEFLMTDKEVGELIIEFESDPVKLAKTDVEYFKELLRSIIKYKSNIDEKITPLLDRPVNELDAIERAILYIGTYELEHRVEIPWKVVINESVELAKTFGAEESHKYINGVMEKLANDLRATEIKHL